MVQVWGSGLIRVGLALALVVSLFSIPVGAQEPCDELCQTRQRLDNATASGDNDSEDDALAALEGQAGGDLPVEAAGPGILERLLSSTGNVLGDAAGAIGAGIVQGASALWGGLVSAARAVGSGTVATTVALGSAAAALGGGLIAAGSISGEGTLGAAVALWGAAGFLAAGLGKGAGLVAGGVADIVGFLASGIAAGATALWDLWTGLRPERAHPALWTAAGATAAAGAASGAGAASWWGWRKLGGLAALAGMPLFSRIAKNDLLEHPMRAQIYEVIKANPGVHISEISRRLDVGWGTTIHHLRKLRAEQLVSIREVNNQKCYFLPGAVNASEMAAVGELKHPTARQIAVYIGAHPLSTVGEISESLDLGASLVSFHVSKLVQAGLAQKVRDGRFVRVAPTRLAAQHLVGHGDALSEPAAA